MYGTIHERAEVLRDSIENRLEHEENPHKCFVLAMCHELLFSVDYTQSNSLRYSKHLRHQYETIARWSQSENIPADMAGEFESVRHSLARTIPLKREEIEKYGYQRRRDDASATSKSYNRHV